MKALVRAVLVAAIALLPGVALAGSQAPRPIPTLGEAGLLTLAVGLVGGGFALLRRQKK